MAAPRPTLQDVAARSGFALRTVKKVMSGDLSVRDKNREAILRAAEDLHYVPNRAASALGRRSHIRIAVVYARFTDLYFSDMERGFQRAQAELFDYGLTLEYVDTVLDDPQPQREALQALLSRSDIDGVVLNPRSQDQLDDRIDALMAAGKPVAVCGTDAPGSRRLFYTSCDPERAGRIAGQLLCWEMGGRGSAAVFCSPGHDQINKRTDGFAAYVQTRCPQIRIDLISEHGPEGCRRAVNRLLDEGQINGIFCAAAPALYVGQVLKERRIPDFPMVGFDYSAPTAQLLRERYISALLDERPDKYAYLAVKKLFQYLTDGAVPAPVEFTPSYILTSESIL